MKKTLILFGLIFVGITVWAQGRQENIEFYNSISEGQNDINLDFHAVNGRGTRFNYQNTVLVTVRGNEFELIAPFESSNQIQYYIGYGNIINGREREGKIFALVESVSTKGYYTSNWVLAYVNQSGTITESGRRITFPEEGWYAVNSRREVFKLNPPYYTPPPGYYWVIIDHPTWKVIWWKN